MADHSNQHAEWLSLIEVSGPFLAEPVLQQAFPQGLEKLDPFKKKHFRQTYEEWREAINNQDPLQELLHKEWIDWVIKKGLEWDESDEEEELKSESAVIEPLKLEMPEHGVTLRPDYALFGNDVEIPYLLVKTYSAETQLNEVLAGDGWSTSPAERMSYLCRATGTRLGLLTNGEQWMLIDAPKGGITSYASWYARLWSQEPITLSAFCSLLNIRTVFNPFGLEDKKLPDLLDDSLKHQEEVTETLGEQVQRAVEVLIQSLDRINNDSNGQLLEGVKPTELYEAGLTFMMRLVFLLCAEERGLLLLGDETYEANYALSTLRMKLREEAGMHGEEVLSYRTNAWSRLLAIFRAVYGGVEHESMRMPALGGSLFDPNRFPFLEGRPKGSDWKVDSARPLPIDNRTVLLFLDAIQLFQGRTLSYRALDVEQIGYVYEGLLERTVVRSTEVSLELQATKSAKKPWVLLGELASAELDGQAAVKKLLKERTGSSASRITNDLAKEVSEAESEKLLLACHNDAALRDRIKPYYHFLQSDSWGNPRLYLKDAFMVATGTDRRETGTHYTPKSLTEAIVKETLEPVVYVGPAGGKNREDWQLKSPAELLALKICDPAMGSGAFLVQVCRWLSERLCEAWLIAEKRGYAIASEGDVVDSIGSNELMPKDADERLVAARRLIAESCIYGVDVNPLAVELAKLSIWLVTLSKGRPFGFLDHNLRSGDSLLGIHNLDQLYYLTMEPEGMAEGGGSGKRLFAQSIESMVSEVIELRKEIRQRPVRDIRDVEVMSHLNDEASALTQNVDLVADMLIGNALTSAEKPSSLANRLSSLAVLAGEVLEGKESASASMIQGTRKLLAADLVSGVPRNPFHWPLTFPEVFGSSNGGFDAIVGNVPFLGGTRISGTMGTVFRQYLVAFIGRRSGGRADLAAYFLLQIYRLIRTGGTLGIITTNTIAEGDTRQIGLEPMLSEFGAVIYSAYNSETWPGKAAVVTSRLHIVKGAWQGRVGLNKTTVTKISAFLSSREDWSLKPLQQNSDLAYIGSYLLGSGFLISEEDARNLIASDPKNKNVLYPFLNGKDLNHNLDQKASRWVVNFFDWPEEKAKEYIGPYKIIEQEVKPVRLKDKKKIARDLWWQHWRPRSQLYHAIGKGQLFEKHPDNWLVKKYEHERVLALTNVSKSFAFQLVPSNLVFSSTVNIFAMGDYYDFACMQSSIHATFAWKHGSRLKNDLRYTATDIFLPFPRPEKLRGELESIGAKYHEQRVEFMKNNGIGLTKFYNMFHDSACVERNLEKLRELHKIVDEKVAQAYEWEDILLDHGFHEVGYLPENDRIRYTLSVKAQNEVLDRLTVLNKSRFAGENPGRKTKKISNEFKVSEGPERKKHASTQIDIFGNEI